MKTIPFTLNQIKKCPTPFHIYDEKAIRQYARKLIAAFSWTDFQEFFAVKACPNPYILKILKEEGFGADCSSMAELLLAEKVGLVGEKIMFTSNNTPKAEIQKALELKAIINLDDITHISLLDTVPEIICFRYNPGNQVIQGTNSIIGNPVEAKYGLTKEQLFEAYRIMKDKGVKRFGLHTMIASNSLNPEFFIHTAQMMWELVQEISLKVGITFEFVNLGGGIGIPYRPEDQPVDLSVISQGIKKSFNQSPLKIYLECGRAITGPYGYLVTTVRHVMKKHKDYVGVDASMADLMRPALYGAYHHITVMGKENLTKDQKYDVVGSLCENNDKFAINRQLPKIEIGDILVIHDTGAHGYAMGFNYNGTLRHAEWLLKEDGGVQLIRRAETVEDLFLEIIF